MKKFIIKVFLFALLVLLLNIIYMALIKNLDRNFTRRVQAQENATYDYLIIGNSLSMDGIDAELLSSNNKSAYNLSIGGASLKTNYIQLQEYLKLADSSPEVVILGVGTYMTYFNDEEIHPVIEFNIKNSKHRLTYIPMIKFRWITIELLKKLLSKDHRNIEIVQGQFRTKRAVSDLTKYNLKIDNFDITEFETSKYIPFIAALCDKHNIQLRIIEMPGFKNTQNNSPIGPYKLTGSNIEIYNFNNIEVGSIFDSEKDWLGNSHLNQYGAKKFTKYFSATLDL